MNCERAGAQPMFDIAEKYQNENLSKSENFKILTTKINDFFASRILKNFMKISILKIFKCPETRSQVRGFSFWLLNGVRRLKVCDGDWQDLLMILPIPITDLQSVDRYCARQALISGIVRDIFGCNGRKVYIVSGPEHNRSFCDRLNDQLDTIRGE